jgi:hypothetical protein
VQAHFIKDRRCNTARAVFALESEYKWALSGTPLQNRVGELYSLVCTDAWRNNRIWFLDYEFLPIVSADSLLASLSLLELFVQGLSLWSARYSVCAEFEFYMKLIPVKVNLTPLFNFWKKKIIFFSG